MEFNPPPDFVGKWFQNSGGIYYATETGTYIVYEDGDCRQYSAGIEEFAGEHRTEIRVSKEYYIKRFKEGYAK